VAFQPVSRNNVAVGRRIPALRCQAHWKERNGPPKFWALGYVGGPNVPACRKPGDKCEGPVKIGFVCRPSQAVGRTQVPSSYCLTSLRFWLRSDTFQPSWVRLPGVSDADLAGRAGPDGCPRSRCVWIAKELTRHSQYPTRWVTCARRRPCFRKYQAFPRRTPPPGRGAEGANGKSHPPPVRERATNPLAPGKCGWPPTPITNRGGSCLELLSDKGLESALLEEIGLKHETVSCHHGAVFPKTPMDTRTVPWLHSVRLPPREQLPSVQNGKQSVPSRYLVRCVSLSPLKSGNKPDKPQASTDVGKGKGFAGHCNPSS